jgi:hypothetical protein
MASPHDYSVHDINQQLRGHNYFYNDFLMTIKYQNEEGIASAVSYFDLNVLIISKYLKDIA